MHIFEAYSNESMCRKCGRLEMEQVIIYVALSHKSDAKNEDYTSINMYDAVNI